MSCLIRAAGTLTWNQKEILDLQAKYYKELYQSDLNVEFILKNEYGPKIMATERNSLDQN